MNDPIALLKRDHREAEALLKQLSDSKPGSRRNASVAKLETALTLHMQIEEQLIYPLVAELVNDDAAEEATNEHELVRDGLLTLSELKEQPGFGAAVAMLTAGIKYHVKEEEHEVFPALKRQLERGPLAELGDAVVAAKRPPRRARARRI